MAMGQMEEGRGRKGHCTTTQPVDTMKHTTGAASWSQKQGLMVCQRSAAICKELEVKSVTPAMKGVNGSLLDMQGHGKPAHCCRPCPERLKAR